MLAGSTRLGVQKGERICCTGILGQGVVLESRTSRVRIEDDILEDGSEPLRRAKDLGFRLRGEPDRLRIRAVLEVEDTALRPSVFIIPNQPALWVSRQGRLPGTRETEKERGAAIPPLVCRAVHGGDTLRRKH